MKKSILIITVCVMILALAMVSACLCEGGEGIVFPVGVEIEGDQGPQIIEMKAKLNEYGFYDTTGVEQETLQSHTVDDLTMIAIKKVCEMNSLQYSSEGITFETWWRVMGMDQNYDELNTPSGSVFFSHDLYVGTDSDAVNRLRARLIELDYDSCGIELKSTGALDDECIEAVAIFAEVNKINYDPTTNMVSGDLQDRIFDETAKPAGDRALTFPKNFFFYMKSDGDLFGLQLPHAVIWGIGLVIIAAIVFLLFKVFSPKPVAGSEGVIEFDIEYNGNRKTYRSNPYDFIRIGRNIGSFPIDIDDRYISRKHCEISYENGEYIVRDFSAHGTSINGNICSHNSAVLHDGDVMIVGKHKMTIHINGKK